MEVNGGGGYVEEKGESRVYVGNVDFRITEAQLINMFSPYGNIVSQHLLLHTRGPKRGEPRGFAFIQFTSKQEAQVAKDKMHGRLACGRPLVVRLATDKYLHQTGDKTSLVGTSSAQVSRSAKIAAIKNKLRDLEQGSATKKHKQADTSKC